MGRTAGERIAGVILAGGRATRMGGRDKAFVKLGARPLVDVVAERLMPQVSRMAINANGDPGRFSQFGLDVVADEDASFPGPLGGILAGMRWAASLPDAPEAIVTVAVDTPFFPADLVERLRSAGKAGGTTPIVIASSAGSRHPTIGLWPLHLGNALTAFLDDGATRKVTTFVDRHPNLSVGFDGGGSGDPFFNINSPADLAEAESRLRGTP